MNGKNWNSKTKTWSRVVGKKTLMLAARAASLAKQGKTNAQIAKAIGRSESRVRELLIPW